MKGAIKQDDLFSLQRLINENNSAEGSNLSPKQIGANRVPIITGLQIIRTIYNATATQFQLIWNNCDTRVVDHYNIYFSNFDEPISALSTPFSVQVSPGIISIPNPDTDNTRYTITVQTALKNGMVSALESSPSVVGIIP